MFEKFCIIHISNVNDNREYFLLERNLSNVQEGNIFLYKNGSFECYNYIEKKTFYYKNWIPDSNHVYDR